MAALQIPNECTHDVGRRLDQEENEHEWWLFRPAANSSTLSAQHSSPMSRDQARLPVSRGLHIIAVVTVMKYIGIANILNNLF
jgi:hypothetical protein